MCYAPKMEIFEYFLHHCLFVNLLKVPRALSLMTFDAFGTAQIFIDCLYKYE
jgi:hypothetical protein